MSTQTPTPTPPPTAYTLESIRALRAAKREEIRRSARRLQLTGEALFAPQRSMTRMEGLLQHVNAGIAAYDGVMTGLKVLRRIQAFFRRGRHC